MNAMNVLCGKQVGAWMARGVLLCLLGLGQWAWGEGAVDPALVGRYVNPAEKNMYFDIRADGTYTIFQDGEGGTGIIKAAGNKLSLVGPGRNIDIEIINGSFFGPDRQTWSKVAGKAPDPAPANLPNFAAHPELMDKTRMMGLITLSINHAKQICTSSSLWANQHQGKFPERLEQLLAPGYLGASGTEVLHCPLSGNAEVIGYVYLGGKLSDASPAKTALVVSKWISPDGKRVVGHVDGSVMFEEPSAETVAALKAAGAGAGSATASSGGSRPKVDARAVMATLAPAEQSKILVAATNMKRLAVGCFAWAKDHGGAFPTAMADMFNGTYFKPTERELLRCPLQTDDNPYGYFYYGKSYTEATPGHMVLIVSKWIGPEKIRVIAHRDGSVTVEKPEHEDYPVALRNEAAAGGQDGQNGGNGQRGVMTPKVAGGGNGAGAGSGAGTMLTIHATSNPRAKKGENRYIVHLPPREIPADKGNYSWVAEGPNRARITEPLDRPMWHLHPGAAGVYKVWLEDRSSGTPRVASNVVEVDAR